MPKRDYPKTHNGVQMAEKVIAKKMAALLVAGKSLNEARKELGLTPHQAKEINESYECKSTLLEMGEIVLSTAKSELRRGTATMVNKILKTLNHHLDNNHLQAISPALKILGISEDDKPASDTTIQLILPTGAIEPKPVVETTYTEIKLDDNT